MTTGSLNERAHALYRFYGDGDVLLYVGLTVHLPTRLRDHRRDKDWWIEVVRMTVQRYPTREAVVEAERLAIMTERPRYNVQHNQSRGTAMNAPNAVHDDDDAVVRCETFVGSFFLSDAARQWQGFIAESLPDGLYLVALFSWGDGTEYERRLVHIDAMRTWRFFSSDEGMRAMGDRALAEWKQAGDEARSHPDFERNVQAEMARMQALRTSS